MVLEATIIVLDNSKFAINGDILPSRFDAQTDALNLLAQNKLDENQESAVGLMTMGGRNVEVAQLQTGTPDTCSGKEPDHGVHKQRRSAWRL
jgi:26S proteasome regulatory subunit N10